MTLLPTAAALLGPRDDTETAAAGEDDTAAAAAATATANDNNVLRGVPLRQRQLPASFWEEPNVPRYYTMPSPSSSQSSTHVQPSMLTDYSAAFPRPSGPLDYPPWPSYDYGYGTCTCPHCASEKHLRSTLGGGQMAAYGTTWDAAEAIKNRAESGASAAAGESWMWPATGCPKVGGGVPQVQAYNPYATGSAMMSAVVDPSERYVTQNTLWKGTSAANGPPYLSLPYSFN